MRKTFIAVLLTNLLTVSILLTLGNTDAHEVKSTMSSHMSMERCSQMMISTLGKADKNYDLRFIDRMISHHEGAIMMAKDALNKAQHPEIKQLSQNIITSQQKEIDQLRVWRKQWYGK